MAKKNPRRANGWRRDKVRARIKARRDSCAICGRPIDYDLPAGNDWAFEVDEIVPVYQGGNPFDVANCRAVHRICNRERYIKERGGKSAARVSAKGSRDW